jgi:hypothetical protein
MHQVRSHLLGFDCTLLYNFYLPSNLWTLTWSNQEFCFCNLPSLHQTNQRICLISLTIPKYTEKTENNLQELFLQLLPPSQINLIAGYIINTKPNTFSLWQQKCKHCWGKIQYSIKYYKISRMDLAKKVKKIHLKFYWSSKNKKETFYAAGKSVSYS